jgi:hypothetical protein
VREQLPPEWLGVLDECRAIRHRSHRPAKEGGELIGWTRSGGRRCRGTEWSLPVRTAERVGDRDPGVGEQPVRESGIQVGGVSDGAG